MERIFKYRLFDRRSVLITGAVALAVAAAVVWIWLRSGEGGYMTAWVVSFLAAVLALYVLSVPRRIEIGEMAIEIRCVVELTKISFADLSSVRRVEREEMRSMIPLLGSFGFFGYYGYYLDLKKWETVKLYCGRWENFIEIKDIYEQRYIVNAGRPDELVASVKEAAAAYNRRLSD